MSGLLTISRFTSRLSPPMRAEVSWHALVETLSDPCRTPCTMATCRGSACPHKEGGCWSPAVFSGDRRIRQDVETIACLVFDIDHATDAAVDSMRARLVDYQHMIHTTHADRKDDRCMRVVIQLSRAVTLLEWSQLWSAARASLQVPADVACSDATRCYYLPSRPSDADYFAAVHAGVALDVDAVLAAAPISHDLVAQPVATQEGISP